MIDKLSYEEILDISKKLKEEAGVVSTIAKEKGIVELEDFVATVEGYSKFLENTIDINKDADAALSDLKEQIK